MQVKNKPKHPKPYPFPEKNPSPIGDCEICEFHGIIYKQDWHEQEMTVCYDCACALLA